jgi:hypothetical protein
MTAMTSRLVQGMISASGETLQPVLIVVLSDQTRDYSEAVNFVIRKNFRSDYMEAADFINAGHGDVVVVDHRFDLCAEEGGSSMGEMLKRIDVPVLTTLHDVPPNLPECDHQNLLDVCDASLKVVVQHQRDLEVLNKQYHVPLSKIELIALGNSDYVFEPQEKWLRVGRQYWQMVSDQLCQMAGDLRSHQADREHSLLYWE